MVKSTWGLRVILPQFGSWFHQLLNVCWGAGGWDIYGGIQGLLLDMCSGVIEFNSLQSLLYSHDTWQEAAQSIRGINGK